MEPSASKGNPNSYQGVRKGLARLALAQKLFDPTLVAELIESEDIAFRSAAYAYCQLTVEQINKACGRDSELAFNEMMYNPHIWRNADRRQALHDVAWTMANNDKHARMDAPNTFRQAEKYFARDNPDWFKDADDFPAEPSTEPATKADIEALASRLPDESFVPLGHIQAMGNRIRHSLSIVFWVSVGISIGLALRH